LNLPKGASGNSRSVLWTGKPWIFPGLLARSILVIVAVFVVSWFEVSLNVTNVRLLGLQLALWTGLVIFLAWIFSLAHLLLLNVSNTYVLRNDSLEVRVGVLSSKSFAIAPAGFSDLEVIRSIPARIVNSGNIIIRTQGERDMKMERVRNALKVADQIRAVMSKTIVRVSAPSLIEEQHVPTEKKQV
jgi:uncharacterized membrane protein YdbT with pleckstrin-like domain